MASKWEEAALKHRRAQQEYDRVVGEINDAMREADGAYSPAEKERAKKKIDALHAKLREADRKENEAKRQMDSAM